MFEKLDGPDLFLCTQAALLLTSVTTLTCCGSADLYESFFALCCEKPQKETVHFFLLSNDKKRKELEPRGG